MKVIFSTSQLSAAARLRNGSTAPGVLHFEARVYEPGEPDSVWTRAPALASEWLSTVTRDDTLRFSPPPQVIDPVAVVDVPAALLRVLPPDAQVVMEWTWRKVKP